MSTAKFRYQEVIDLGFKRKEQGDPVWFKEFGYEWFLVDFKLSKKAYLSWDCETHQVTLFRVNKEHDILASWVVPDIQTIKNIIKVFGKDEPAKESNYSQAISMLA